MIVKIFMVTLILSISLISDVTGASYSNVYVEREFLPMQYYQYGAPYTSIASPRLSQINNMPTIPSYVTPCGSPCIYPSPTVTTVTSADPNANVLTYKPIPSAPVVITPTKEEATGYEYSYVVYDENTGDHKAQRELSDGSVVQGEYSFIQPDGYVREVQYIADDVSGFNAVVKNFLPVGAEDKRKVEVNERKESSPPCHEIKNESLKKGSDEESELKLEEHELKSNGKYYRGESKKFSHQKLEEDSKEKHHHKSKENSEENEESGSQGKHIEKPSKGSKEESGEKSRSKESEKSKVGFLPKDPR